MATTAPSRLDFVAAFLTRPDIVAVAASWANESAGNKHAQINNRPARRTEANRVRGTFMVVLGLGSWFGQLRVKRSRRRRHVEEWGLRGWLRAGRAFSAQPAKAKRFFVTYEVAGWRAARVEV